MKITANAILFAVFLLFPQVVQAHPGHGSTEQGTAHYVSELVHALPLGLLVAFVIAAAAIGITCRKNAGRNTAK